MFIVKHMVRRIALTLSASALLFHFSVANAVPFNPSIVITGTNDFDEFYSYGNTSGEFSMISGGATTTSTYSGSTVNTGSDPIAGALTDIGDGFGFTGSASATDDFFGIGFDAAINVINNDSITQTVIFRLDFNNAVNADGDDAYAGSEFTLEDDGGEIHFSHLISDTLNGDEQGGGLIVPDSFGASLSESGDLLFSFTLNPLDEINLFMSWTLDEASGDYDGAGLATADLDAFLSVDAVVPLPGSFLLMASGMLLLPLQRLMRKK